MRQRNAWMAIVLLTMAPLMVTAGCGNHAARAVIPEQIKETPLSFLKDGETTRLEVFFKFGVRSPAEAEDDHTVIFTMDQNGRIQGMSKEIERPLQELENGRILVFALDKKYRIPSSVQKARFHLILVFDEVDGGVLRRHSLVRIR